MEKEKKIKSIFNSTDELHTGAFIPSKPNFSRIEVVEIAIKSYEKGKKAIIKNIKSVID